MNGLQLKMDNQIMEVEDVSVDNSWVVIRNCIIKDNQTSESPGGC